jgi:hypothetical protein
MPVTRELIQKETTNDASFTTNFKVVFQMNCNRNTHCMIGIFFMDSESSFLRHFRDLLHNTHLGMIKMKALARSHCF